MRTRSILAKKLQSLVDEIVAARGEITGGKFRREAVDPSARKTQAIPVSRPEPYRVVPPDRANAAENFVVPVCPPSADLKRGSA